VTGVSVVICTYKRPEMLRRALASLAAQTLERVQYEVIVVDNAGGVGALARDGGADVVLHEPIPGVSRARNKGWQAARSELIGFVDDDGVAEPDWLERALDLSATCEPSPVALGGPILPLWDAPRPSWFKEVYELRSWGESERLLQFGESFSGSNMFLTRRAIELVGGFDIRSGPVGNRIGLGGETVSFERLWAVEPAASMLYSPRLVVRHSVPARKMTVRYQLRRAAAYGSSTIIRQDLGLRSRLRLVPPTIRQLVGSLLTSLRRLRGPFRQWAVEELRQPAILIGMLRAAIRGR
jgi:glycosyltransferase involved in cell wall biosynthesis